MLLKFLRQADPTVAIRSLVGHINNDTSDGAWPFFVNEAGQFTDKDVKRLLNKNNIKSWGWMDTAFPAGWSFYVSKGSANNAEQVMKNAGIPVSGRQLT